MSKGIEIEWQGETFVIAEDEVFELAEKIEEIIPITDLAAMSTAPKFTKLARCFSEMINFAGGKTTPREVHHMMMSEIKDGDNAEAALATSAVSTLIEILMDGAPQDDGGESEKGEAKSSSKAAT